MRSRPSRWECRPYEVGAAVRLAGELGVSHELATILVRRGLGTAAEARRFLAADELAARLGDAGVQARSYYRTPTHRQAAMTRYAGAELPVTDDVAERNLALPMGPELTAEQAEAVAAALAGTRTAAT